MSETMCACGCGEVVTHPGATYAGVTDAERNKHRARAAYKRKQGQAPVAGTSEALAALGLADEVTVSRLAATVASAAAELSRRVAGVDQAEIDRRIEAGLQDARAKVESAEERASKAEAARLTAVDELAAAVQRADQADDDATKAGEQVDQLRQALDAMTKQATEAAETARRARADQQEAERKADRATAALEELRGGYDRAMNEVRRSVEAEAAVKLAEQATAHERELSKLREEIVRLQSTPARAVSTRKPPAASTEVKAAPVKGRNGTDSKSS